MSIVDKTKKAIEQWRIVGNMIFDDTEYEELLDKTRRISKDFLYGNTNQINYRNYEIIFVTLIETAKRWKKIDYDDNDESGFWDYVFKTILGLGKDENYHKIYNEYLRLIKTLCKEKSIIFVEKNKKYYTTLMLHAFAPDKSIFSFLDLCYNIYKKDLNFNYSSSDKYICELITIRFCEILKKSVGNDKSISIGTNSYNVRTGLRTLAIEDETQNEFIELLNEALTNINTLFYNQSFEITSYFEILVKNWWQNKQAEICFDQKDKKNIIPAVSKNNISVKFMRLDNVVYLVIPPIRIDNTTTNIFYLSVFVCDSTIPEPEYNNKELFTKRGDFIEATIQEKINLNGILKGRSQIKFKIRIKDNSTIIFDKTFEKDFILFENENEVLTNIKPINNYFLYSLDIFSLKNKPDEIKAISSYLYNIYPKAGESISGNERNVFFQDEKSNLNNKIVIRLIGELSSCVWVFENKLYTIYNDRVIILIPNDISINGLEFNINSKKVLLSELKSASEENYLLFDVTELIPRNIPLDIYLYSHLNEKHILRLSIIFLIHFKITFIKNVFYGNDEKKLTISFNEKTEELNWNNKQNELTYPFNNGELIIKIPYIKWRIDNKEWHNEPIEKKLWYKSDFHNGSVLEINSYFNIEKIYNGKNTILRNKNGNFEIGNYIYNKENIINLPFYFQLEFEKMNNLFTVSKIEHFYKHPLTISNNKLYWPANDCFVGNEKRLFKLEIFNSKNERVYYDELSINKNEIIELNDGIYKYKISYKDSNIFKNFEITFPKYEIIIGRKEKYIYTNKYIKLTSASLAFINSDNNISFWNEFIPEYYIDKIEYIENNDDEYYLGYLYTIRKDGLKIYLNTMENERRIREIINPIRLDFLTEKTLSIIAGYNKDDKDDFLGELIYDLGSHSICNVNTSIKKKRYRVINIYKYEVKNV
jgi:hypothetical protein